MGVKSSCVKKGYFKRNRVGFDSLNSGVRLAVWEEFREGEVFNFNKCFH